MIWHAVDELEHQAVCLDTYRDSPDFQKLGRNYLPLTLTLLWVPMLLVSVYGIQAYLLLKDRALIKPRHWRDWLKSIYQTAPILYRGVWRYRDRRYRHWSQEDVQLYFQHLST